MNSASNNAKLSFKHIALLYHPKIAASLDLAQEVAQTIRSYGVQATIHSSWDETAVAAQMTDFDLIITLGGDGSLLRAARITLGQQTPILGINMGRLGFLAEVQPPEWRERLDQALSGNYWLEERMMIRATYFQHGETKAIFDALNEVVLSRGALARVVRLPTYIDGGYLTTYVADGLITSTATGSTAYALAAGGPILPPELQNILLIPLAPHLSLERAIVLSHGSKVRVQINTDHVAILTVDGQFKVNIENGDWVELQASPQVCRFVRMKDRSYFYHTLLERLGQPYHPPEATNNA